MGVGSRKALYAPQDVCREHTSVFFAIKVQQPWVDLLIKKMFKYLDLMLSQNMIFTLQKEQTGVTKTRFCNETL